MQGWKISADMTQVGSDQPPRAMQTFRLILMILRMIFPFKGLKGFGLMKVVLAYSGGLDTTVLLTWLQEI